MPSLYRIAIDANEANTTQRVGSNSYAYQLLLALEALTAQSKNITCTILLSHPPASDFPKPRVGWQYKIFGPTALWTQWALPFHLFFNKQEYDVLYTPGHYAPRFSSVPYVCSVMDLAFLYFPKQFRLKDLIQLTEWTRYSVKHAKKVIAISQFTRQDVLESYHLKPKQVVVAHPGISIKKQFVIKEKDQMELFKKWHFKHPFFLYVGTLQPRKNIIRLLEAFEKLILENPRRLKSLSGKAQAESESLSKQSHRISGYKTEELSLVIAGKVGWLAEDILRKIHSSPVKNRIILTGYVTEKEKDILLKESLATVLIGIYEGFGIPVLEAMAHGSLPIVANTTSLPEVVGEAGIQVDPDNVTQITTALRTVLEMPPRQRATLLKKGRQQVKKFTWEHSAESVLKTLIEVIEKKQ